VRVVLRVLHGGDVDIASMNRALALEDDDRRGHALQWPSFNAAALLAWRHDVDGARLAFARLRERCVERGAESVLWLVLGQAMRIALWSGDVAVATAFAGEIAERARMTASTIQALAAGCEGIVAGWRGEAHLARSILPRALAELAPSRFARTALYALGALGMLELSVGNHVAAADYLVPAVGQLTALGFNDPEVVPLGPDAAEALIALGRTAEATPIVELLEQAATGPGPSVPVAGACCTPPRAISTRPAMRVPARSRLTTACPCCTTSSVAPCSSSAGCNGDVATVAARDPRCTRRPDCSTRAVPNNGRATREPSSTTSDCTKVRPIS